MLPFYTLRKHQKISVFQVFSGGGGGGGGLKSNINFLQYQILQPKLTHLWPIFLFYIPWKHKARGVQGVKSGNICLK